MWSKIKKSAVLNILLVLTAIWVAYSAYNMVSQALSMRQETEDKQKKIALLGRKKEELEAYIAELQSREAIEREAKSRLNLKLPGEEVVVVVPDKDNLEEESSGTLWEQVKAFFKGIFGSL